MHVYNYIQYTVFDSTNREALWKALPIFGCPANCVTAPSLFTICLCAILVIDLQYADKCAILVYTAEELHTSLTNLFVEAHQNMPSSAITQYHLPTRSWQ